MSQHAALMDEHEREALRYFIRITKKAGLPPECIASAVRTQRRRIKRQSIARMQRAAMNATS